MHSKIKFYLEMRDRCLLWGRVSEITMEGAQTGVWQGGDS